MTVPTLALLQVLVAAFFHAGWNLLAKTAGGGAAFVWLCTAAGTVVYAPAVVVALVVAPGHLGWTLAGFAVVSGALHAVYFVLLQRGYLEGDLSYVYPLARGTGPLLSTGLAIAIFAERPAPVALLGAALIVGAVFSLAVGSPQGGDGGHGPATVFALLTGSTIAAYTLWDKQAVDATALSPVVYLWAGNLVVTMLLTPLAVRRSDELTDTWRRYRRQAVGVGLLSPAAYILVLFALTKAPVSYVAPARETSILIGAVLGATVLSEGDTRRRIGAAVAVVAGVAALAAG